VFLSQFQPSEPFLADYFVDNVGLTRFEVYGEVFNLYVYARLPCIALVGVLSQASCCSSRYLLIAGAFCGLVTNVLTRFGTTLLAQQLAEFTAAAAVASRFTVMGLVFTVTEDARFQSNVHIVHATLLLSNFLSAVLGEILRDVASVPLRHLFDISTCSQAFALLCAIWLPRQQQLADDVLSPKASGRKAMVSRCWTHGLQDPIVDLWLSLKLRIVAWWTIWTLAMGAAHNLSLTYWQAVVKSKDLMVDHNGYALASMYLAAGVLTALSRHWTPLGSSTSALVIVSMLAASVAIWQVVHATLELQLYGWLLAYQCIYHLSLATSIFQVGDAVTQASSRSTDCSPLSMPPLQRRTPRIPVDAKLTLLFSMTGLMGSVNENIIQLVMNFYHGIDSRLQGLSFILVGIAALLFCIRCIEACLPRKTTQSEIAEPLLAPHEEQAYAIHVLRTRQVSKGETDLVSDADVAS
jgi:uncharacterized membrane protein YuzA (DUF378 family)